MDKSITILLISILVLSGCSTSRTERYMSIKERCKVLDAVCDSLGVKSFSKRAYFPYDANNYPRNQEGRSQLAREVREYFSGKNSSLVGPRKDDELCYVSTYDYVKATNANGSSMLALNYKLAQDLYLNVPIDINLQETPAIKSRQATLKQGQWPFVTDEGSAEIQDLALKITKRHPTTFLYSFSVEVEGVTYKIVGHYTPHVRKIYDNSKKTFSYKVKAHKPAHHKAARKNMVAEED